MKTPLVVCFLFLIVGAKRAVGLRTRNVIDPIHGGVGRVIGGKGVSIDRNDGSIISDNEGENDRNGGDIPKAEGEEGRDAQDKGNAKVVMPIDEANQSNIANICSCDFTERLNFIPQEKTKVVCNLNPHHGEEVKIWVNKEYEVKCFQNSRVYCPSKDNIVNNTDITTYSPKLKYNISDVVHRDREVKEYHLQIDKDASDILLFCSIKPKQVSELLEGEVKINLKREISEEYSIPDEHGIHACNFSKGNLDISPSAGFYYKNDRSVSCIYLVIPNKLFLIKLPKLDIVTNQLLPSLVNCLSEHSFINFNLKHVEEGDESISLHLSFGDFKRTFNLSCAFDLSEYVIEPCLLGKKGIVTFYFNA
ncbi:conserved Plasmodium protein, unknown function [Plasmodium knowlesi strain H]|uniref:6-cysteine protein n=3 Tax=Plasmodium knowlesi TaxID=5850 RepID=A0A5K1UJZ3_PLAKH|nr:cysteine-rich small secreted protein CSS [Plasmodium knowlesi strain H]OTN67666.1 Uncharacterized protein PKNOH_S05397300 [Plasmodium knowlesi]CAA9990560.1 cysteine-rich small secreted protein CSS [Plasmodium knowlesi strain H]SBO19821.1 conserved Plasmodium protein, unknown function [Plasmodium knowlesi strain H]SBO22360.1 conserved Plasmodium protein, unknown function [Plasmodium knowlesi strain H]VVS80034.1 cysteine-rich small secreted protein CSS [Plasmodium knowlesi strain H]|eukprot:XP_002260945.1 hypothetical protein, conserved in Plasmodium species [Plasmodium knowlesi strain H]